MSNITLIMIRTPLEELIGCIGPREVNNRTVSHDHGSSRHAMEPLFKLMGGFSKNKKADLLVMDW